MNILITGGAGFIGSHLAEFLINRGDKVTIIDNLSTGSMENIQPLINHPNFRYHIDTIMNRSLLAELIDLSDITFHLAAAVGVKLIVESPVQTIETNIRGTEEVLSIAAKKKKTVLIASTSEVYGKRTNVPFNENDDLILGATTRGRWSYACSKAIDEFLALAYWREKKLPSVIVRLFNTVGPRQTGRYGMVIPNFVRQALTNEDITIYGDGSQTRCFGHVFDVIGAMVKLIENPKAIGEVFNIGGNEEISIKDLAEKIKDQTGSMSELSYTPYNEAYEAGFEDMLRRVPDLQKVNRLIGYTPQRKLNTILNDVIEFERERVPLTGAQIANARSINATI